MQRVSGTDITQNTTIMNQESLINSIGITLINQLESLTDEESIKSVTIAAWKQLREVVKTESTFNKRALISLRKIVSSKFPESLERKDGYYKTSSGKGKQERYEHLSLWYLTSNANRWDVTGDIARGEYYKNLPSIDSQSTQTPVSTKPAEIKTKSEFKKMTVQQLELDRDTENLVQQALEHTGLEFSEFIKQACTIYSKTLIGRFKHDRTEIEAISTEDLLSNPKYRTLPGKAEELAKRAIEAIKSYNDFCTERSQKWMITETLVVRLTGSQAKLVRNVFKDYKTMIDDHNHKHGLNTYDNRKRDGRNIEDDIRFKTATKPKTLVVDIGKLENVETEITPETELRTVEKIAEVTDIQPIVTTKTVDLPLRSSSLDIFDYLKQNPTVKVRIRDGRIGYHYVAHKNESNDIVGFLCLETEELTTF